MIKSTTHRIYHAVLLRFKVYDIGFQAAQLVVGVSGGPGDKTLPYFSLLVILSMTIYKPISSQSLALFLFESRM